jgi:hypothetical protein
MDELSVELEGRKRGRPKGSGKTQRMLRVLITPRQDRLLRILQREWGLPESEHVRRALDAYLDALLASGDLVDERRDPAHETP